MILALDELIRAPFDAAGIFSFFAARAVPGVESVQLGDPRRLRYARTLRLPGGPSACEITALQVPEGSRLQVRLELAAAEDEALALWLVRRLLDLDAPAEQIDAELAEAGLADAVRRTPGIRVPGAVDPQEIVIRAIIGQQISVKAATTHLGRLSAAVSTVCTSRFAGLDRLFPDAGQIAGGVPVPDAHEALDPDRVLRLPRRSIAAVAGTARALELGELQVGFGSDPAALRAALLDTAGIGPWTAAYIGMRVLGDADAWLPRDVALASGAARLGLIDRQLGAAQRHRVLEEYAQRWAPWRSYAAMHLWQAAGTLE
ncbi:hypothetical protein AUR04nite_16510 [Glutamicibacter uratoxydans]|uniref:DNA-3-methyladenine glycosylase II n=2 Tax=Glutamicibacter uratoxydans TaxID=43667 RepID=A0A4Y4DLC8_GLUUR|nr:hypothetical protein AUR04nite_16510 [Glutamicibacter uratoxydans]